MLSVPAQRVASTSDVSSQARSGCLCSEVPSDEVREDLVRIRGDRGALESAHPLGGPPVLGHDPCHRARQNLDAGGGARSGFPRHPATDHTYVRDLMGLILAGRPGRGSSSSPFSRCSRNRRRHLATVCGSTPHRAATATFAGPPHCLGRGVNGPPGTGPYFHSIIRKRI
jgi:hypothetical protein